jgi:predicted transcriptional regulator
MPTIPSAHSHAHSEHAIDLTSFGFTPTESLAYAALLETGPTGGYALAKRLNVARANAYQALNGLVSKGAASMAQGRPQRFKAVRPDALFAMVLEAESRKLDALETQIRHTGSSGGETLVDLIGARAVHDLVMRTAAREEAAVACAATSAVIAATAPGWRRRRMIERSTHLWCIGARTDDLPVDVVGAVDPGAWPDALEDVVLLMTAGQIGIAARNNGGAMGGFWTTDQLLVGLIAGTLPQER